MLKKNAIESTPIAAFLAAAPRPSGRGRRMRSLSAPKLTVKHVTFGTESDGSSIVPAFQTGSDARCVTLNT